MHWLFLIKIANLILDLFNDFSFKKINKIPGLKVFFSQEKMAYLKEFTKV